MIDQIDQNLLEGLELLRKVVNRSMEQPLLLGGEGLWNGFIGSLAS